MRASAKVSFLVAKKILTNHLKGSLPFKPEHGEHGDCSWFLVSGQPYTGVSPDKNIDVDVEASDTHVKAFEQHTLQTELEAQRKKSGLQHGALHRIVWDMMGQYAKGSTWGLGKLWVPEGEMSRDGSGWFLVVSLKGAQYLQLLNAGALQELILFREPDFLEKFDAAEKEKDATRSKTIRVEKTGFKTVQEAQNWARELLKTANGPTHKLGPYKGEFPSEKKQLSGASGWGGGLSTTLFTARLALDYGTYRAAREAFKRLKRDSLVNNMVVNAPDDWPDKQKTVAVAYGQRV